jgi:ketosteroid isomerase-like protein
MDEAERRALIRRYWENTANDQDQDITHEIYHDDAVLEFPQSGERFEGVANFKEWRSQYPASVTLEMRDLRGRGDLWVVEGSISYDGGPSQPAVNILEFRGDKVARETIYVTEPWEAPEWRARWRAAP